jgi:tRNA(Ile)-lysidine synthase
LHLVSILRAFFTDQAPLATSDTLLVAFSGGPDSTALLAAAVTFADERRCRVVAAHLDHGLDPGSRSRAEAARGLARHLGVPVSIERHPAVPRAGESPEAAARRVRYAFLETIRSQCDARWIATAHHADDQAETVLLRLLQGSSLEGLAGIQPLWGRVARPFLGLSRRRLAAALDDLALDPLEDPTNRDPRQARSRVRHALLPHLEAEEPGIGARLARLATAARQARARLRQRLAEELEPRPVFAGMGILRRRFATLPAALQPAALALLHQRAGAPYPAGAEARKELLRQLEEHDQGRRVGCDSGRGWRWEGEGDLLVLRHEQAPPPFFTYTFEIPGGREIPDLRLRMTVRRAKPGEDVSRRELTALPPERCPTLRAALALPFAAGGTVAVRNRRPGDRIQPLGCRSPRRLKEVLIDRRVPRLQRDHLPLLEVGGKIAWVPGVTIDASLQVTDPRNVWIAKIEPI